MKEDFVYFLFYEGVCMDKGYRNKFFKSIFNCVWG